MCVQPFDDPYIPKTYPHLLKWKFPHMNSVDFKLDAKPSKRHTSLHLVSVKAVITCCKLVNGTALKAHVSLGLTRHLRVYGQHNTAAIRSAGMGHVVTLHTGKHGLTCMSACCARQTTTQCCS